MITTSMKPGVKTKNAGAASSPATAERTAAKPQPIDSIHGRRTPNHGLGDTEPAEEREEEREDERGPERPAVMRDQRPRDVGGEHPELALCEVDDVSRAVDQDECECEAGAHGALAQTRHVLLDELRHQ